ncbi:MAG: hypothetical protein J5562_02540 [Clostridia bacterium]|nr:hypothetical protein [Clostridia bacterium]
MNYKALVTAELDRKKLEEAFAGRVDFFYGGYAIDRNVWSHDKLKKEVENTDVLICEYDTVTRDIIEAANKLKIIICCRGGVKTVIDLDAAMEKGIIVCNNIGRNAGAVTDMVMGYILDLTRNITKTSNMIFSKELTYENSTKPNEYKDTVWGLDNDSPLIKYRGKSIKHMTLGIIGYGHAGKKLAKKANAFGMRILTYDPYSDFEGKPGFVQNVSWNEILTESDIISLHCVLTPQTKNMFSKSEFEKMKKNAIFINTARGELVVEEDLVEALNSDKLASAALDVTIKEPIPSDSILLNAKNLIITPHIAGSSDDVQICGTEMTIKSLKDFIEGKKPHNCVVYI